ncbi:Beta-glucanase, GH16 family [Streptomyces sp. DvalAA-14]|uniref:galactose-binding domain-containing protein n=1 Tax=unclassified Streptomyces TaxID=2593676 RepID=UPI00081AFB70|nr:MULTISPECIES: discoidin domain-containing protein [unclassified Streptomyces]MYS21915.1 family 16 glycosylhydrolase [Streptomyces sp. SID4948]SCE04155.1 Beta-glucanase, GH16 family [Streptomyces sp. DvalAA-14]
MSIRGTRLHRWRRRLDRRFTIGLLAVTAVAAVTLAGTPAATASASPAASGAAAAAPQAAAPQAKPAAVQPNAVPAAPSGFTTTWSDDFNGAANTGLNTDTWRYDAGAGWTFGTGEIETMTNSTANVYQDGNGHLVLKALHTGTDPNANWTSGRVETQADGFGAQPGGVVRMQASIQQPNVTTANGAGYWPAFWMLGSPLRVGVPWPGSGEVDILEDINGRSSVFGTLHCGVGSGGPCNETSGVGSGERACSGCQTGYHTYAVEVDRSTSPEQIRWYLDGANFFTLNSNQVDATAWANAVDHSYYIIFDLAIGGGFPAAFGGGPNAATVSGGQMNIDYVAVYNKAPAAASGTNIAKGKPTTASSAESATFPASNATDGDITTRWSSGFSDPQWLQVDLGQSYAINHATLTWEAAAASAYQLQTSADGTNWTTVYTNNNSPADIQDTALNATGRYVRVYATARASQYGDSLYELALYGTPSSGGGGGGGGGGTATLLSQGKTATASSTENVGTPASAAVDGNTGTRWSSAFSDPQWLEVDLGATHTISQVVLNWETAYGTAFQIQTSADGTNWTTVYSTTTATGGVQTLPVTGSGRYVRLYGTARSTQYGYSLWEFQVYGT